MKFNQRIMLCMISTLMLFISCNSAVDNSKQEEQKVAEMELIPAVDTTAVAPEPSEEPGPKPTPGTKIDVPDPKADWDKKIIKTATLKLELKDYKKYTDGIRKTVKQFGGYIANEEQTQTDYQVENVVTIKVPVDQFENAMNTLPGKEAKITERKITAEDVTSEYVDVKSRLASRKQVLNKYYDFLKQAKTMEEMLQVQNEINEIQENIESAAGRAQYLSHSAAYSTINLTYYQLLDGATSIDHSGGFLYKLKEALKSGWSMVGEFLIAVIAVWPLWLLIAAVIYLFKRFRRKTIRTA